MGFESGSGLFTNIRSNFCADAAPGREEGGAGVLVKPYPVAMLQVNNRFNGADGGESRFEPYLGMQFDSADDARDFYCAYAIHVGFRARIGQLYRSRSDGSVSSRRFVCSREGFQLNSRTGCPAFIRVQKSDSGKWVIDRFHKDHNHELGLEGESCSPTLRHKTPRVRQSSGELSQMRKIKLVKGLDDEVPCLPGVINVKRMKRDGHDRQPNAEPYAGLVFSSADEAHHFYQAYAENAGFRIRIGQLFRSKADGSITSRRFVCSKEGFQHPSRVGCGAFMRIKIQESGYWVVDRLEKEHNHDFQLQTVAQKNSCTASKKPVDSLDSLDLVDIGNGCSISRRLVNNVENEWYRVLLDYFQVRQAEDTGFFYSVEVDRGSCMSVFWADGRSRFSCSQFGDVIILDTSYRKDNYVAPFATFVGINHHKHPVLFACALIANESKESFTWLLQTWLRAMSGRHPKSIIADQDEAIQQAIAQVFPRTHHRFSLWQIRSKEQENLSSMSNEFRYEYEKCIYQSQTVDEFSTTWNLIIKKYGLIKNLWLKEMKEKCVNWVPLYLRGSFFAGIQVKEGLESFFGTLLNAQTPLGQFISRYEQGLKQRREEERKDDYNTDNLQPLLQTKEPVEEQCRRLYTLNVFKIFQNELLQCYNYLGLKTYEEGIISRYSVRRCGNEIDKQAVTLNALTLEAYCSCQMFEFEGVLCRHVLRVFNLLDIKEIPSRYLLHRWTRNASNGFIGDVGSVVSSLELKASMAWSLRETACKYIESGTESLEMFKLAYDILQEGGKKLCWQR